MQIRITKTILKTRTSLVLFILFILITSCSKKILFSNLPTEKITKTIPNSVPSLVFFTTKNENITHDKIYQRFYEAFGNYDNFPVLTITDNEIVSFQNNNKLYFQNNTKEISGLILSDGNRKPFIEFNPENYIKSYEAYFDIKFNDKEFYKNKRTNLKNENEQEATEIVNSNFTITKDYAEKLIKNSSSAHYTIVRKKRNSCNSGQVYMYSYSDSLKTKKLENYSLTKYNKNNQVSETIYYNNKEYQSETKYYYNKFNLIDSIITVTKNKNEISYSKNMYVYQKDNYSIIDFENNKKSLSKVYNLNSKLQCTSLKSYNNSATVVRETFYKYDEYSRLIEENQEDKKMVYTYENPDSENYFYIKVFENNEIVEIKNTNYKKDGFDFFVNQYKGKLNFYYKTSLNKNNCIKEVYNYDKNNKFTILYEYVYE